MTLLHYIIILASLAAQTNDDRNANLGHAVRALAIDWLWQLHPPAIVGKPGRGLLLFGRQLLSDERIFVKASANTWVAGPALSVLHDAHKALITQHPSTDRLVVGDASTRHGGRFSPHRSHQTGQDIDLRYLLKGVERGDYTFRFVTPQNFDVARNWTYIKAILDSGQVNHIYMDKRHQRRLWRYAVRQGKFDRAMLNDIFGHVSGRSGALIRHVRGHFNHFHVSFKFTEARHVGRQWSLRSARQLQRKSDAVFGHHYPHVVQRGDTLASIARRYNLSPTHLHGWNGPKLKHGLMPGTALQLSAASSAVAHHEGNKGD